MRCISLTAKPQRQHSYFLADQKNQGPKPIFTSIIISKYEDLVTLGDLTTPLRHLGNQGTLGFLFFGYFNSDHYRLLS